MDSQPPPLVLAQARPSRLKRFMRRFDGTFLLTVLLPTLAAVAYFGFLASDVYVSESRFVVRSPQRQMSTGLGALLQGTGFVRSQDDTYSVHDYILSRDSLTELDKKLKLRQMYTRPEVGFVDRFASTGYDPSFEALHRYYLNHVSVNLDTSSGISILQVRAYTAADAKNIGEALLQMSERLVNDLNRRSQSDLIQVSNDAVARAETRAKSAALAVSTFRSQRSVFDPNAESAMQLQRTGKLKEELLSTEALLDQVRRVSPANPQVEALASRAALLRAAIASETGRVTGGKGSLAATAPDYERLVLEQSFADKQLASAMASLEQARHEAAMKQLYLERLAQPNEPDKAVEPRRIRGVITVLVVGLLLWGVVSMLLASIREHAE